MIELDEESVNLTTFATPFCLHQYLRLPMGIRPAGAIFGRRFHAIFSTFFRSSEATRCMEDILLFTETYEEMLDLMRRVIRQAAECNVSFNLKKTEAAFAVTVTNFAGFEISSKGYGPSDALNRAIATSPHPTNVTDLRSFNGLRQQVGNFSDQIASAFAPLSPLLKKKNAWQWLPGHEAAFQEALAPLGSASCELLRRQPTNRPLCRRITPERSGVHLTATTAGRAMENSPDRIPPAARRRDKVRDD